LELGIQPGFDGGEEAPVSLIVAVLFVVALRVAGHLVEGKPKKITRQKEPPIDLRPHQTFVPHISLIQEKLIGRVVVEFSRLDHALSQMIWHLLKLQMSDGRLITTRMEAQAKIALLEILAPRYFDRAKQRAVLAALNFADLIREDRNFIVHGLWGTLLPDDIPMVASIRPKTDPNLVISEAFPQKRLREIISNTIRTTGILTHMIGQPGTSPEK
jgi:hypothetical protein